MKRTKFVTFYSYKGGVGRTLALGNIAWEAALRGKRVVVIDFDLEAPGIPSLIPFQKHIENHKKNKEKKGGIFELIQYVQKHKLTPSIPDFYTTEPIKKFVYEPDKIFICYAREDKAIAKKIYDDLKNEGFKPWLDSEDILVGENWKIAVEKAIKECSYFLTLLSSTSVSKNGFVQKELKMALEFLEQSPDSQYILIPVRLNDCKPESEELKELQWVDLFPDYSEGFNKVIKSIRASKKKGAKYSDDDEISKEYKEGGEIYIVPAGKEDTDYRDKLQAFDWEKFYEKQGGMEFFLKFRETIEFQFEHPDFVFIDSRTGLTDIGGICTLIIPDRVVILTGLNNQNLKGSRTVIDSIEGHSEYRKEVGYLEPIEIITVGTHVPYDQERELTQERLNKAKEILGKGIKVTFPYVPILSLEERLLVQEQGRKKDQSETLVSRYRDLYRIVVGPYTKLEKLVAEKEKKFEEYRLLSKNEEGVEIGKELIALYKNNSLDPGRLIDLCYYTASILYSMGRYSEAVSLLREADDLLNNNYTPDSIAINDFYHIFAISLNDLAKNIPENEQETLLEEAINNIQKSIAIDQFSGITYNNYAFILIELYHLNHNQKNLLKSLELSKKAIELGYKPKGFYNTACIYSLLGEKDKSFKYLSKVIENKLKSKKYIQEDKDFDNLRDDPRFQQLLENYESEASFI